MHPQSMSLQLLVWILCICLCQGKTIELWQSDFDQGTYQLSEPGEYKLMEDIIFNPNKASGSLNPFDSSDVSIPQFSFAGGNYNPAAFGIGFFAAMTIYASDVTLDLNGHVLAQSTEHALQQRFFAVIELADCPFIPSQGPHNFGPTIRSASNLIIKNGIIGLSSHHGIHGNSPFNITIQNVDFKDYEIAAIAINGGHLVKIENVRALGSRKDIPVYGSYSAARFIRPYVKLLREIGYEGYLRVGGIELSINEIYQDLHTAIENVYNDIIGSTEGARNCTINESEHPKEYALFHNHRGISDGNSYGILTNNVGVAINDFPTAEAEDPSESIILRNVEIYDTIADIQEVVVLENADGKPVIDPVGAVFQIFNKVPGTDDYITISSSNFEEATYIGNSVANAQAFVGKAILAGAFEGSRLDVSRSGFTEEVLAWIEADIDDHEAKLAHFLEGRSLICNTDTMVHVNKGVIGLKADGARGVKISNVKINNVTNYGKIGSDLCGYDDTTISHPLSTLPGYQGATSRGISFSGSVKVKIEDTKVETIFSHGGSAYGIDVLLDSHNIDVKDGFVDQIYAAKSYERKDFTGPNAIPEAVGYSASSSSYAIRFSSSSDSKGNIFNNADGLTKIFNDLSIGASEYSELLSSESTFESYTSSTSAASELYQTKALGVFVIFFLLFCSF